MRPMEAQVGAYMEAIEFAMAEHGNNQLELRLLTPEQITSQPGALFDFFDLCPVLERTVSPDLPVACVQAHDVRTGQSLWMPAELALHPFPNNSGQAIFGTSTNGLASGNTEDEAVLHGTLEFIERDIKSFDHLHTMSTLVDIDVPGSDASSLKVKIEEAGLELIVRYTANRYSVAYFDAFVLEQFDEHPIAISAGAGAHLLPEVAAVRAISEAAQSRLTHIHGGRDDIIGRHNFFEAAGRAAEIESTGALRTRLRESDSPLSYNDLVSSPQVVSFESISEAKTLVLDQLERVGVEQVLTVRLTPPSLPLSVVHVMAPTLEHFKPTLKRVGPRLARYLKTGAP